MQTSVWLAIIKVYVVLPSARYPGHAVQASATSALKCWPVLEQIPSASECALGSTAQHLRFRKGDANVAELWRFIWSAPDQTVEQRTDATVIWDAVALIITSL